jgi:tetratricopeptide (TPR) repeat protein
LHNAQRLEPDSPDTLIALGYYQYWVLRDFERAKTTFKLVSKVLPNSSDVPFALGAIARREGHWNESISALEQALVVDPRNTELIIHAGDTYGMLRNFRAALKLYDRALDLAPKDRDLLVTKAGIYQALGDLKESAKCLAQLDAQNPEGTFNTRLVIQLLLERNQVKAIELLHGHQAQYRIGSAFYESPNLVNLALVQRLAGDAAAAKVTAQAASAMVEPLSKQQPENAMLAANLSLSYALLGQNETALTEGQRAISLLPTATDAVDGPEMEENFALVQMLVGDHSGAISTLGRLLNTPYDGWYYLTPVTTALLRLDPTWDPLRNDPRFQKLCEEKPKTPDK